MNKILPNFNHIEKRAKTLDPKNVTYVLFIKESI